MKLTVRPTDDPRSYHVSSNKIQKELGFVPHHTIDEAIGDLIKAENQRGVATERIAIAGFSQGGAMALHIGTRHPEKLAGVIALSCYLPRSSELATAPTTANQATPIFMAHGTQDPVVPYPLGDESRRLLESAGYSVEWHAYPMPHGLCEPEVAHLRSWLKRVCETPQ